MWASYPLVAPPNHLFNAKINKDRGNFWSGPTAHRFEIRRSTLQGGFAKQAVPKYVKDVEFVQIVLDRVSRARFIK